MRCSIGDACSPWSYHQSYILDDSPIYPSSLVWWQCLYQVLAVWVSLQKSIFWKREIFKILKNLNLCLFFLCLGCLLSDLQFCDFSKNKSCKTYWGPMLPCGGRNWQLLYHNHRRAKVFMMTNTLTYCSEL